MLYPRDSATPEAIGIGTVRAIADGSVQTSGVTVRILPHGSTEANGNGTVGYTTDGIVTYTPTTLETGYTSFILIAKKASCYPVHQNVFTFYLNEGGQVNAENALDPAETRASLGVAAANLDTQLAAIAAKTGLITSGGVVNTSNMVDPDGEIDQDIVIGTDYLAANSRSFTWVVTPPTGYVAGTSTCRFGGSHVRDSVTSTWDVAGSITNNGNGTWTLSFDLSRTVTGSLTEGEHRWSVDLIDATSTEATMVKSGKLARVVQKQT